MKQHVNFILSDGDMNDIATQFMACDRELEVEIEGSNVVLHLVRDDAISSTRIFRKSYG